MLRLLLAIALLLGSTACKPRTSPLIRVEGGSFLLGSPAGEVGRDDDEEQHRVTLSRSFLLGRHEVTRGEWARVMGEPPAGRASWGDRHPATVSWVDAVRYCNARSALEGLPPAYTLEGPSPQRGQSPVVHWNVEATGYRLPTEAEWARAARGGPIASAGAAHCGDSNSPGPRPVGGEAPDAAGFHDLIGNIEEWVFDRYAGFDASEAQDPRGPSLGRERVARGGGYSDDERHCRVADRSAFEPDRRLDSLGFRVARWADDKP